MASINIASIMNKVGAYSRSVNGKLRMRECIQRYSDEGKGKTEAGDKIITEKDMHMAAAKMIQVLRSTAQSYALPASVMSHFDSLDTSSIIEMPDGSSIIYIYFGEDLHRDSLAPKDYSGIDNVVALINNGYGEHPSMAKVWGEWRGARIHGLTQRTGLHFIQQAVQDFNGNYGSDYNVTAIAGDEYN